MVFLDFKIETVKDFFSIYNQLLGCLAVRINFLRFPTIETLKLRAEKVSKISDTEVVP